jgi:general secretion pathway protein M
LAASRVSQAGESQAGSHTESSLLDGATDAVAAAALQQRVQDMATRAGATLTSAETLPATQTGAYRRIGLHVSLNAPWAVLARLLAAVDQGTPRMLVDDLQLHGARLVARPADPALDAGFTVFAFRAAAPPR